MIRLIIKIINKIFYVAIELFSKTLVNYKLWLNKVEIGKNYKFNGIPTIDVKEGAKFVIGDNFVCNNGKRHNRIGRQQNCFFIILKNGKLSIGNNVGISGTAIICANSIIIEDNVKIGGNTCIYDTDFHSLKAEIRKKDDSNQYFVAKKEVIIKKNAFIGAHVTILKGAIIGENSIIGACSVVSGFIPDNEIWAGNPAKFIRKLYD